MKIAYANTKKKVKAVPVNQPATGNYVAKKSGGCGCKNFGTKKVYR
ncbi:hypothetical protein [Virgibacillus senegalensis]|nr:hypothetical protein [Virgibacillus senegalensis]